MAQHPATQDLANSCFRNLQGLKVNLVPMTEVIWNVCVFTPKEQFSETGEAEHPLDLKGYSRWLLNELEESEVAF